MQVNSGSSACTVRLPSPAHDQDLQRGCTCEAVLGGLWVPWVVGVPTAESHAHDRSSCPATKSNDTKLRAETSAHTAAAHAAHMTSYETGVTATKNGNVPMDSTHGVCDERRSSELQTTEATETHSTTTHTDARTPVGVPHIDVSAPRGAPCAPHTEHTDVCVTGSVCVEGGSVSVCPSSSSSPEPPSPVHSTKSEAITSSRMSTISSISSGDKDDFSGNNPRSPPSVGSPRNLERFMAVQGGGGGVGEGGVVTVMMQADRFKQLFSDKTKVIIHSKQTSPTKAFLYIDGDDLCWTLRNTLFRRGAYRMALSSINTIKPGTTGEAFQRKSAKGVQDDVCVTVVSDTKALAIEFRHAVTQQAFVSGCNAIAQLKHAKALAA